MQPGEQEVCYQVIPLNALPAFQVAPHSSICPFYKWGFYTIHSPDLDSAGVAGSKRNKVTEGIDWFQANVDLIQNEIPLHHAI